jgi:hypothetical protein
LSFLATSIHSFITRCAALSAAAGVPPSAMQPGSSGTSAMKALSSGTSR